MLPGIAVMPTPEMIEREISDWLSPFDAETSRIRFAMVLHGESPEDVAEVIGAREDKRAAIAAELRERAANAYS